MIPTGVRNPVVCISIRALIGIVQALVTPGIRSARSISSTSSSQVIRSGQKGRSRRANQAGAQPLYQAGRARHSDSGRNTTTVSIIESGAGSVEVSARPAFPKTRRTSGNEAKTRSCVVINCCASRTPIPGSVVGM